MMREELGAPVLQCCSIKSHPRLTNLRWLKFVEELLVVDATFTASDGREEPMHLEVTYS